MSSPTKGTPPDFASRLFINNMSLKQFNLFIGTVLLISGTIFLLSSMSPVAHITRTRPSSDCNPWIYNSLGLTCEAFSLDKNPVAMINIVDVNPKNKFVILDIIPFRNSSNLQSAVKVNLQVSAYTIQENDPSVEVSSPETVELTFDCSESSSSDCGTQTVITLKNLKYKSYYILVKVTNSQDIISLIEDFAFITTTLNTTYKNYVFFIKLLFMLASFAGYVFYIFKTFSIKKDQESKDLKTLELFFPFLLLINEPFTSQMFGGIIYSWVIIAAFTAFSAFQIRFWILSVKEIAGSDPSIFAFDDKMLKMGLFVYGGVTWMTYVIYQGSIPTEPGSEFLLRTSIFFNLFRLPLFVILGLLVFYMVKSAQVIIKKSDPENERENYFFWFSAFFFIVHVLLVALGGLSPISHDGPKLLLFSGLSTLYILSASYLYLPNKDGGALSPGTASKPANTRTKGSYLHLDDSHEFAPQTANQGNSTGRKALKSPGGAAQENYPPEIKAEEDF